MVRAAERRGDLRPGGLIVEGTAGNTGIALTLVGNALGLPQDTLAGIGSYPKEQRPGVVVALADPMGSAMYHHFVDSELCSEGSSITEGIGQGRVARNVEAARVDRAYQISDEEALSVLFELLPDESLCMGGSSGVNVAGAIRLARDVGPGHTIVTILPDGGQRYQSKLFDPLFLAARNLPIPPWLDRNLRGQA